MPFLFVRDGAARAVEISTRHPAATLADLCRALGADPADGRLTVDGEPRAPDTLLASSGLHAGSTLAYAYADAAAAPPRAGPPGDRRNDPGEHDALEVRVTGGLDAGARVPLDAPVHLGRSHPTSLHRVAPRALQVADPTVSIDHATIHPPPGASTGHASVQDHASTNGTWRWGRAVGMPTGDPAGTPIEPGDVLRLGATEVSVWPVLHDRVERRPLGEEGPGRATRSFDRPPRTAGQAPHPRIVPPHPPEEHGGPSPIGLAAIGFGFVAAGVAVVALHSWLWGLFALLGPVMLVASTLDQRRHGRRRSRRATHRFRQALQLFEADLAATVSAERAARARSLPDPAEVLRRVEDDSRLLWERRPSHTDAFRLRLGTATTTWEPPIVGDEGTPGADGWVLDRSRRETDQALHDAIDAARTIDEAPFPLDLAGGVAVGIAGPRPVVEAVTRSLLIQLCILHGPADVELHIATAPERLSSWAWTAWLPHGRDHRGVPRLAARTATALLEDLAAVPATAASGGVFDRSDGPTTRVLLLDDLALVRGQRSVARRLLGPGHPNVSTIVLAERVDQLPAGCQVVVAMSEYGEARLAGAQPTACADLRVAGLSAASASRTARALAAWSDPERDGLDSRLPDQLRLFDLLDLQHVPPEDSAALATVLLGRWTARAPGDPLRVPIGSGRDGPVEVDLDRDGPHALVAGTTGAGKSELLRTFVAGLAARASPAEVSFVLIDFKGGSAFDRCVQLPHTVGVVTDLDGALAARAIRGIRRELRRRELLLREAGAIDLLELRRRPRAPTDPPVPPRLVVVVDEFATLATELPDVLEALVAVAQRGRSLGLHLVLATQRPAGVVSDRIRANTSLRIALRLPDEHDSLDVVDAPDAARLPRHRPGRALVRFGPDELEPLQVALVQTRPPPPDLTPVTVIPFPPPECLTAPASSTDGSGDATATDLEHLVAATRLAVTSTGDRAQPALWSPPLPTQISPQELAGLAPPPEGSPDLLAVLLADRPDETGHDVEGWHPGVGPLLVEGPLASGTTTTLRAIVRAASTPPHRTAWSSAPTITEWYVHILDGADRGLADCALLPGVANVVASGDAERRGRLVRILRDELVARQQDLGQGVPADRPPLLLVVDDLAARIQDGDDPLDPFLDALGRLVREGTSRGVHVALGVDRFGAVPPDWRAALGAHWLLGSAGTDPTGPVGGAGGPDGSGGPTTAQPAGPGRAVLLPGRRLAQVVLPNRDSPHGHPTDPPPDRATPATTTACRSAVPAALGPVGTLPRHVTLGDLGAGSGIEPVGQGRWLVPVGIGDRALTPVWLPLGPGGLALVAGPPRSGRTNALSVLGAAVDAFGGSGADPSVVRIAGRAPGAPGWHRPAEGLAMIRQALTAGLSVLALVDDLDALPDDGAGLAALVHDRPPGLRLVASTSVTALRSAYGHVVRDLRGERCGILLAADLDLDGELLGTRLPRRAPAPAAPGRGWLIVDGEAELTQLAYLKDTEMISLVSKDPDR